MVLLIGRGVHIPIVCPSQTNIDKKTMEKKIVNKGKSTMIIDLQIFCEQKIFKVATYVNIKTSNINCRMWGSLSKCCTHIIFE
jgi:hypothetical protein